MFHLSFKTIYLLKNRDSEIFKEVQSGVIVLMMDASYLALKGEEIPLAARIFAIVDVWDALRSERPYRKSWSDEKILTHLREQSGKHFDPQVVDAFFKIIKLT